MDFSVPDIHGNYALHVACAQKNIKSMTMMLGHGADPTLRNAVSGETALDVSRRVKDPLGEKLMETFMNLSDDESDDENNKNSEPQSKPTDQSNLATGSARSKATTQQNDTDQLESNVKLNSNN